MPYFKQISIAVKLDGKYPESSIVVKPVFRTLKPVGNITLFLKIDTVWL